MQKDLISPTKKTKPSIPAQLVTTHNFYRKMLQSITNNPEEEYDMIDVTNMIGALWDYMVKEVWKYHNA